MRVVAKIRQMFSQSWLRNLINLALFQSVWVVSVIGAASGDGWHAFVALAVFVFIHHFLSITSKADFQLAVIAVFLGIIAETFFTRSGIIIYSDSDFVAGLVPIWILVLWANFALTFNGCLQWLHGRYWLAALLGAAGGPISYYIGIKLGAATAGTPFFVLLAFVAVVYAAVAPLLLLIAKRLVSYTQTRDLLSDTDLNL
jgi:hypothetical protein